MQPVRSRRRRHHDGRRRRHALSATTGRCRAGWGLGLRRDPRRRFVLGWSSEKRLCAPPRGTGGCPAALLCAGGLLAHHGRPGRSARHGHGRRRLVRGDRIERGLWRRSAGCAPLVRARLDQIANWAHQRRGGSSRLDQGRAGAATSGFAPDGECRHAEPCAAVRTESVLSQPQGAPVDPAGRRTAPWCGKLVRIRGHKLPRGTRGIYGSECRSADPSVRRGNLSRQRSHSGGSQKSSCRVGADRGSGIRPLVAGKSAGICFKREHPGGDRLCFAAGARKKIRSTAGGVAIRARLSSALAGRDLPLPCRRASRRLGARLSFSRTGEPKRGHGRGGRHAVRTRNAGLGKIRGACARGFGAD